MSLWQPRNNRGIFPGPRRLRRFKTILLTLSRRGPFHRYRSSDLSAKRVELIVMLAFLAACRIVVVPPPVNQQDDGFIDPFWVLANPISIQATGKKQQSYLFSFKIIEFKRGTWKSDKITVELYDVEAFPLLRALHIVQIDAESGNVIPIETSDQFQLELRLIPAPNGQLRLRQWKLLD